MGTPIPMLDLMFFLTENQDNPRHVGAILIFQRPARGGAEIVRQVFNSYRRTRPVPPFNRIPVFPALGLPEWHDAASLDMAWHVQRRALPAPGSDAQLHELVGRLHAPMLRRDRPGWQVYVIVGLERNRFAIYVKVHHALVDGESGIALVQRSLAHSARDRHIRSVVATELPAHAHAAASGSLANRLEQQVAGIARRVSSIGIGARRLMEEGLTGLLGFSRKEIRPFTAPRTPMNEPIHNARILAHTLLPLDAMQSVARAWGTTLNDVALCALDAGMNRYLRELGRPADHALVVICPVSLHDPEVKHATTEVTNFWAPLGKPTAAVGQRMRQVIANTRKAKKRIRALPKDSAYAYSVLSFALGETLAIARSATAEFFLPSNVLISNVRGPSVPLYLNGARLEVLCPVSTLIAGMGLNITFMSYAGQVMIGYTANASALPRAERLAEYTREAFTALERHTRQIPRARVAVASGHHSGTRVPALTAARRGVARAYGARTTSGAALPRPPMSPTRSVHGPDRRSA